MNHLECEAWWTKCDETHEGDLDEAQAEGWTYHALPSPSRWFCPNHADAANMWRDKHYPRIADNLKMLVLHLGTQIRACSIN